MGAPERLQGWGVGWGEPGLLSSGETWENRRRPAGMGFAVLA